jgi:hypothetical protein
METDESLDAITVILSARKLECFSLIAPAERG